MTKFFATLPNQLCSVFMIKADKSIILLIFEQKFATLPNWSFS